MKRILTAILVILAPPGASVAQGAFSDAGFDHILLHHVGTLEGNYQEGHFLRKMAGGVDMTFVAADPSDNLKIQAETVDFVYGQEDSDQPSRILLEGGVHITNRDNIIRSEKADVDFQSGMAVFTGNPVMNTEQVKDLAAEKILVNLRTGDFEMFNIQSAEMRLDTPSHPPKNPYQLSSNDVRDWPGLLEILKDQGTASAPTPGRRVIEALDKEVRAAMATASIEMLVQQHEQILEQLNRALASPSLYDEESWEGIPLAPEAMALIAQGTQNLPKEKIVWFNRHLLQAAYPRHIAPPGPFTEKED